MIRPLGCITVLLTALVGTPAPAQSDSMLAIRIDSALRALQTKGFSGVVRVDRNGKTIIARGYGLANRSTNTPFTPPDSPSASAATSTR